MDAGLRYWAFLSYSHADRRVAERLHRALETYRIPPRLVGRHGPAGLVPPRLSPIFRDRDELAASEQLGAAVEAAMSASAAMVVLCSPASSRSQWVDAEVRAFEREHPDRRLLCVLLDGAGDADRAPTWVPPALHSRFHGEAGLADTAPLAVDLRAQGDGWRLGVQKLVASLAGVPLDQLVQRDTRRRHRRLAWLAAASLLLALAFGTLSVFALRARDDARLQRAQAEGLVEFMLGDLRHKLEPVGRLDVLDSVGLRALRYYDSQSPSSLDADALGRRARALHMVGEISDERGDLASAARAFEQAAASTDELLRRAPDDPQRLYEHAQSVFWLAMLRRERGRLPAAEHGLREYAALVARQVALEPGKLDWRKESGYADSNIGTVLLDEGKSEDAIGLFTTSLRKAREIADGQPDTANWLDYAQGLSWLSSARFAAGQLAEARSRREAEIALYRRLQHADPGNHQVDERLLYALRFLAELQLAQGDLDATAASLDEADGLAARLLALEPDNTGWSKAAAHLALDRAELLQARDPAHAPAQLAVARARIAALLAHDPKNFLWRRDLQAPALLLSARMASERAQRASTQAVAVHELEALHAQTPHDRRVRSLLAQALLARGDALAQGDEHAAASRDWEFALDLLPPAPAPLEPDSRSVRAALLERTGAAAAASADFATLQRIGFHQPGYDSLRIRTGDASDPDSPAVARRAQ